MNEPSDADIVAYVLEITLPFMAIVLFMGVTFRLISFIAWVTSDFHWREGSRLEWEARLLYERYKKWRKNHGQR